MKMRIIFCLYQLFLLQQASAASIKNEDNKPFSLVIVEGSHKHSTVIEATHQVDICAKGCFITLDTGDKYALIGDELIDVANSKLTFR